MDVVLLSQEELLTLHHRITAAVKAGRSLKVSTTTNHLKYKVGGGEWSPPVGTDARS